MDYDVIYIGSGNAAWQGGRFLRKAGLKILIVEDEAAIAELEKDYLELSGFEVDVVNDGNVGLESALEKDYDLVISFCIHKKIYDFYDINEILHHFGFECF